MSSLFDDEVTYCRKLRKRKYSSEECCPSFQDQDQDQNEQINVTDQINNELIVIKDSSEVDIQTSSTQGTVGIQSAVQTAIFVITEVAIGDMVNKDGLREQLMQIIKTKQINTQKTYITNSNCIRICTDDSNSAIGAQLASQTLTALLVILDIL